MKYVAPELTMLEAAISAVQSPIDKENSKAGDVLDTEGTGAYADWE